VSFRSFSDLSALPEVFVVLMTVSASAESC
jgi:hypothetical protein